MDFYKFATFIVCFFIGWYALTSVLAWYRLRKFPTPSWLAHFSYLWLGRLTYSGKQYWVHRELHRKYGPLVRIGPNEIMTDDPDIIRSMSSTRSTFTRGEWYIAGRFNPHYDILFTVLGNDAHKKARSRVFEGYSGRETGIAVEHGMDRQVTRLIDLIRQKYAVPGQDAPLLNIVDISSYFTMDVITELAFGQEFGYLQAEEDRYGFFHEVHSLWPQMSTVADVPWIRRIVFSKPFLKLLGPRTTDSHGFGALMRVAHEHVQQKFSTLDNSKGDMMESFIRHGLTQEECEAEGLFTIIAGTESTAGTIRSILIHILSSPVVYSKLKNEIHDAVQKGPISSPISNKEVRDLPYLQAVIQESIRMRPPLLGLFPKVVPAGGVEYHGQFIPGGTHICMNTSSLLHSKSLFGNDPSVFRPERFMEASEDTCSERRKNLELAFGHGQNQCLGKTIAIMELSKVTFEMFRNFDFQTVSPWRVNHQVQSYGVFLESNMKFRVSQSEM
ncbi:hypothetical protein CBS12448_6822 [Aspergillus niger]|nr:hypothetical protein CBS133816_1052 [Aspergillus niger]KAI2856533.1 hypothetical protein CBS12448_6822 [Aspergillus niger]KAI2956409.1 hypothetical protein CBS147324_10939 [Aspergillus niger]KAI3004216.1 hypothetical protein CBS147345_7879 [Aspergillus niger]